MKINPTIFASAALAGLSFVSTSALAQGEAAATAEPAAEGSVSTTAAVGTTTEAPAPVEAPAPAEEAAPEEAAEPEAPAEPAVTEAPVEEAAEEEGGASLFVFADAWMGWQTSKSGSPQIGGASGGVYALNGPGGTQESGFGLSWLGTDFGYDGGMWAVNGSLRFGDAVALYNTGTLGPVTSAYLTLRPVEGLSIDAGVFTTIYGAEVAESWNNLNYSRGELYYNFQPFWHTGVRAAYEAGDFVVRALVANDTNQSNLGEGAVNVGLQAGYNNGTFGLVAGALQSLAPVTTRNNTDFIDTFIDVVATVNAGDFSLVGNFDLNVGYETGQFWGASLAAGYKFVPAFGMAIRGEYLATPDGELYGVAADGDENLITGTLTFDVKPIPDVENVVLRWDNSIQVASEDVYANGDASDVQKTWFGTVLGAVIYADLL